MAKLLLLLALATCGLALGEGTTLEAERDTQYQIGGRSTIPRHIVVVEAVPQSLQKKLRPGFGAERIASVLRRNRIAYRIRVKPKQGWGRTDSVGPKLVFSAESDELLERTKFSLSLITYSENDGRFTPTLHSRKDLAVEGRIAGDTQGVVARFLTRSTAQLLKELRHELARGPIRIEGSWGHDTTTWLDRDPYRGKFFVGLAAGYSGDCERLQAGYWGSDPFCLVSPSPVGTFH
ncbi:MAG: hypothetical protein R3B54_01535 [Bdellovibrionota bacterium]